MTRLYETLWAGLLALLPGGSDGPAVFPGYVEGQYVYVAADAPGRITAIAVSEGMQVLAGDLLFTLDARLQAESLAAAQARVKAATATLANLQTGARPQELAVADAALAQAEADLNLARRTLERSKNLLERKNISEAQVDTDQARANNAEARVNQLRAELAVQQMPARDAQVAAAAAELQAAEAEARQTEVALSQQRVLAPAAGRVERLFYEPGEVTGTAPVLSILPDSGRIVRFYVPQDQLSQFAPRSELPVSCDGCPAGLTATFSWIASDPEYTPPIIFSREERSRLVFRAEAQLPPETTLLPGQPVTVEAPL